jgi:hypothetical protein
MNTSTAQDQGTPAAQHDCGVTGHRGPSSGSVLGLKARLPILKDDRKGSIVGMGAAAIGARRGSSGRGLFTKSKIEILRLVQGGEVNRYDLAQIGEGSGDVGGCYGGEE